MNLRKNSKILHWFVFFFACYMQTSAGSSDSISSSTTSLNASLDRESFTSTTSQSSWNTVDIEPEEQLSNSTDLIYNTLFQNLSFLDTIGLGHFKDEVYEQSLLLRRLYLLFLLGGIDYKTSDGQISSWPFPLATLLTQGQRVLIVLDDMAAQDFLNFITNNNLKLFYKRKYSSHGVILNKKTGVIEEVKIKNPFRQLRKTELILGLDFPFGGIGTELPDGYQVGPRGWQLKGAQFKKNRQLGHLQVYIHSFPQINKTAILIGIEACAPGFSNAWCNHNLFSGLKNQKLNRSVSGGGKWGRLSLSSPSPAEYGGKATYLSRQKFTSLVQPKIDQIISTWDEKMQETLFSSILKMSTLEGIEFLRSSRATAWEE